MNIDNNIPPTATHRAGNMFFRHSPTYPHLWEHCYKGRGYKWSLWHGHVPTMVLVRSGLSGISQHGEALLNLYLDQARTAEREEFAEVLLKQAEAILVYALLCGHIDSVEHGNRIQLLNMIRAQRERMKALKE